MRLRTISLRAAPLWATLCATCLLILPNAAKADPDRFLRDLLAEPAQATSFAPGFLAQIPVARLEQVIAPIRDTIGPVTDLRITGDRFTALTASHMLTGRIGLNASDQITTLFFDPPVRLQTSVDAALAALRPLAAQVDWHVTHAGTVWAETPPDTTPAVASAFKLGVLAVLADDIASGARHWGDVVILQDRHKSLPTGMLQDMPGNAPLTLHTLAALMIAQSDNTATDLLMDVLGRDRIGAALDLTPALTTRDTFILAADPVLAAKWADATPEKRQAMLPEIAKRPLPGIHALDPARLRQIGWAVSLPRLCGLLDQTKDLPLFRINPGAADLPGFAQVAYKGGSLSGVLSFVSHVTHPNGASACVAVALRQDGEIALEPALAAYRAVLLAVQNRLSQSDPND